VRLENRKQSRWRGSIVRSVALNGAYRSTARSPPRVNAEIIFAAQRVSANEISLSLSCLFFNLGRAYIVVAYLLTCLSLLNDSLATG